MLAAVSTLFRSAAAPRAVSTGIRAMSSVALPTNFVELNAKKDSTPLEIMDQALAHYGMDAAISFSGAEDVVLIEYAKQTGRPFRVFSLDTGRLHPETYQYFADVEAHYGINIEYMFPNHAKVEALVQEKGMFSFYKDGHKECCGVRKVEPLNRKLNTLKAWITGQRKDQSPGTRTAVPFVEVDPVFKGQGESGELIKFNPLSDTTSRDTWTFIRANNVPFNPVHLQGMVSIGCLPCTRPITPEQHEREGRWWWESTEQKECGLHSGNTKKAA